MNLDVSRILVWRGYQFSLSAHELSGHGGSLSTVAYHAPAVHGPNQK